MMESPEDRYRVMSLVDAMQIELGRKACPNSIECRKRVTSAFFNWICSSARYTRCHEYNRKMESLRTPFEWAVESAPVEATL